MGAEVNKTPAASTTAQRATGSAKASRRRTSSVLLSVIALLALVGSGIAWFQIGRNRTAEASRPPDSSQAPKYLVHLEGFTVNLADAEETHFLRVTMDLGIDRLPEGADREKLVTYLPIARIRDSILSVLTVCKADALLTAEGKTQLKKNLVSALNQSVPELGVREVYFTEFLVQR